MVKSKQNNLPIQNNVTTQTTQVTTTQHIPTDQITTVQCNITLQTNKDYIIQKLQEENMQLREELHDTKNKYITELENKNKIIGDKDEIIKELRRENEELREEIARLNKKIDVMEIQINHLQNKLDEKEKYKSYIKCRTAIQDLNGWLKLEQTIPDLKDLRDDRNSESHYIYDNDPKDYRIYKVIQMHEHLINLDESMKIKFNKYYPNVLDNVIDYIEKKYISRNALTNEIRPLLQEKVDDWWNN